MTADRLDTILMWSKAAAEAGDDCWPAQDVLDLAKELTLARKRIAALEALADDLLDDYESGLAAGSDEWSRRWRSRLL